MLDRVHDRRGALDDEEGDRTSVSGIAPAGQKPLSSRSM